MLLKPSHFNGFAMIIFCCSSLRSTFLIPIVQSEVNMDFIYKEGKVNKRKVKGISRDKSSIYLSMYMLWIA